MTTSRGHRSNNLKLRDGLASRRHGVKQWAFTIAALLVVSVGIRAWLTKRLGEAKQTAPVVAQHEVATNKDREAVESEMVKLREGITKFPETEATVREQQPGHNPERIE